MTTYRVPYTFVPGTKAKATEVNANFSSVMDLIEETNNNSADINLSNITETAKNVILNNSRTAREIGEIVVSALPITDSNLHLLDGSLLDGSGIYSAFVDYIASIYDASANYFCTEAEWQQSATDYGVCGKFVYDSVNNTVRLPLIEGFTEGTIDTTVLGDLTEAGLPNITGTLGDFYGSGGTNSGAFGSRTNAGYFSSGGDHYSNSALSFDASLSNSIYGNSTTVQPQSIKVLYYIVIATSTKTDIQVDIDEIATDLNGKMDSDLSNMAASQSAKNTIVGWGLPDYTARITISTGSYTPPSDGLIIVSGGNNNQNKYINVNGARAASAYVNSSTSTDIMAFVQKNDSVAIAGSGVDVYFCPLKGVV